MSQITLPIYADYVNRKLVTASGGAFTPPLLTLGDTLRCPLRLLERGAGSTGLVEGQYFVRSVRASIGKTMDPPASGGWNLELEDPDNPGTWWSSASLALDISAGDLLTAVQALFTHIDVTCRSLSLEAAGCWIFATDADQAYNLRGGELNTLRPVSFVRTRAYQEATQWWYEVRLIQAPLVFNEDGFERVLPPPPSVSRIQAGSPPSDGVPGVNELQDLDFPPDFRGTYFFRFALHRSVNLGWQDGQDVAADALNGMFGDGLERFKVTTPEDGHGQIEFVGELAAAPQDLITVEVFDYPLGVITFDLPLTRAELASALRTVATITLPLEIEIEVVDAAADVDDMDAAGRFLTLCQLPVTIVREGIWPELATVRQIDWQRPTSPRTYLPFNPSQLIPGQQHYSAVIGDGESTEIVVDHNLGTKLLAGPPLVAESPDGGRVLTVNQDVTVTIESANSVKFTFAVAPAENSLFVVITTAGPVSTFIHDLHIAQSQVDGLLDTLATLGARVGLLEDLLPTGTLSLADASAGEATDIEIPDAFMVFPNWRLRNVAGFSPAAFHGQQNAAAIAALPKPPALFPAVHASSVTPFSTADLPASPVAGTIYKNTGAAAVPVPGAKGLQRSSLAVDGFVAYDGRAWYRLHRADSTNSYFPADFELTLLSFLDLNDSVWKAGQRFTLLFDIVRQLLRATTDAQYLLVIEHGTAPSQTSPATTATNLADVVWNPAPLLTQRLVLSALQQTTHFGIEIKRGTDNAITARQLKHTAWTNADSVPLSPNFQLRVRAIGFDTNNSAPGAVGYAFAALTGATASVT